jgi:hypothetical protein
MRIEVVSEVHYRFEKLAEARNYAISVGVGLFVLWWWSFFAWSFLMPGVFLSLCVPPAVLWAARRWPTLVTLRGNKHTDLRVSLEVLVAMAWVVPLLVAYKLLNCSNLPLLALPALIGGGLLTFWALGTDEALRSRKQDVPYVGLNLMMYVATLALWANHALPAVSTERAVATVTALRTHRNITGPLLYDVQTSESALGEAWDDEYSVPRKLWEQLHVGSAVGLEERWGVFGVAEAVLTIR